MCCWLVATCSEQRYFRNRTDRFKCLKESCNGRMLNQNLQTESEDTNSTNQERIGEFYWRHCIVMVSSWVDPTAKSSDQGWRPGVGALPWQNPRVRTQVKSSMKSDYWAGWIWINTGKLIFFRQTDKVRMDRLNALSWFTLLQVQCRMRGSLRPVLLTPEFVILHIVERIFTLRQTLPLDWTWPYKENSPSASNVAPNLSWESKCYKI